MVPASSAQHRMACAWMVLASCGAAAAAWSTVNNTRAHRDALGRLMDVHDGEIVRWENSSLYYWYGMGYRNCTETRGAIPPYNCPGIYKPFGECGFRTDHAVNLYTSPDLQTWTFVGDVLPHGQSASSRPPGIYFRPKVIYNRNTSEFVLWINHLPEASTPLEAYPNAGFVVSVSKSPEGPFRVVTARAAVAYSGGGDLALFVDPHGFGAAYVAYDAWQNGHSVSIERLTDDYHDSLGNTTSPGLLSPSGNEAPILFERHGAYYLLYGHTCCFCTAGAGSRVLTAPSPLGPWRDTGVDLNPVKGPLGPRAIPAQESFVFRAETVAGTEWLFAGDMWGSAKDGLKAHDLQYWSLLRFNDSTAPATIQPLSWVDHFALNLV